MKNTITLFALLITTLLGNAQIYESYKHVPDQLDALGNMGREMAADDEWVVVGAQFEFTNGGIHIYRRVDDTWEYFQHITPYDQPEDYGSSVAIENGVIAVGCENDEYTEPAYGSVYMYVFNGSSWVIMQKITNPTGSLGPFEKVIIDIHKDIKIKR